MPSIDAVVECPVYDSFRVQQVAGMFDVPLAERSTETFSVEVPSREEPWQIGMIVGPSGSGKSTIARKCFTDFLYESARWADNKAIIDCFGDLPVRETTGLLTAVGFSSPPSWVKPFRVLSGGEQFRCDLARALSMETDSMESRLADKAPDESSLGHGCAARNMAPLVVFDEFTSVVDRKVAKICSAAVSKGIRGGVIPRRFVAVTCHRDVAEWLEPDWLLDMATGKLDRRRLRRPSIELRIYRCKLDAWEMFKRHHYLTGSLAPSARCYLALWNDTPVAFCATLPVIGRRRHRRFTRIVTLPDYQGIGIGMRMVECVAGLHQTEGHRVNVTSSHPALIRHAQRSPLWRTVGIKKGGSSHAERFLKGYRSSIGRAVVSFEFLGEKIPDRSVSQEPRRCL